MSTTPSNRWRDPDFLVKDQYRNASNLNSRIQIYRFGSNPIGWYQWLFDHFRVRAGGRVLQPGGRFYASTIGAGHMAELGAVLSRLRSDGAGVFPDFTLETGEPELRAVFDDVTVDRYHDVLRVPEVEPLLTYLGSGGQRLSLDAEGRRGFTLWAQDEIAREGFVRISTSQGVFEAC